MSSSPNAPKINWLSCIGDSITNCDNGAPLYIPKKQQYPKLVRQMIGGNCRERNLGVPGNRSDEALARMNYDILRTIPTVATIYLGINDKIQSIASATTQSNIQSIIDQLRTAGCTRIVLCNIHTIISGGDASYDTYRTVIQNLATSNNLPLCDFHSVSLANPTDYQTDNLHLKPSGLSKLAVKLKETLDTQGWTSVLQS